MKKEEIFKKVQKREEPQYKKINKSDCVADSGQFKLVFVKNEEYFQIEEAVDSYKEINLLAVWYYLTRKERKGIDVYYFDEYGIPFRI